MLSGGIHYFMQLKLGNFPDTLNFILDTGSGGVSGSSDKLIIFICL